MSNGSGELSETHEIVAIVRVRVSAAGELRYGEAIDASTSTPYRFRTWGGLLTELRALARRPGGPPSLLPLGLRDRLDNPN